MHQDHVSAWPGLKRAAIAGVVGVGWLAVAAGSAFAVQTDAPKAGTTRIKVDVIAKGLDSPWAMAFLDNGDVLITEKPGGMKIVRAGGAAINVTGLPPIADVGQGGLLDVVTAPDFAETSKIFFSYSEPRGGGRSAVAVSHAVLNRDGGSARLENVTRIFQQQPAVRSGYHFGSRIVFRPDGTMFVTLGDRGRRDQSQKTDRHWAKVVRIAQDGSVPNDNPFVGRNGVLPEIWSIGHRNVQGADLHPETGQLWTVEHGARGGDEINLPEAGKNYGWPVISYGRHYSGGKIGVGRKRAGLEQPKYYWDPSIAPSGLTFYSGDLFPDWKGDVFVGALKYRLLVRLDLNDAGEIVGEERLLSDIGERIRHVRQGPDGALYVLTDSGNGKLLRITPAG
ncbi:MAG: PQQ-dependent sugar dehydrogenase [Pseudomonadota bacterium]